MTPHDQVIREMDRLRRLAASVHVTIAPPEATREEVEQFARKAQVSVGEDLAAFWLAGESFVLMSADAWPCTFYATPFQYAARDWFGYEREVHMHFGPLRGQTINASVPGTSELGLLSLGSDGGGDKLYLALRDGPHGRTRHVLRHDHESEVYVVIAEGLPAFLRESNDLVERDLTAAFFHGNTISRIFQFPGVDELHRQLDSGLDPNHGARGSETLLGMALDKRRDDVFHTLLKRGADAGVALAEAARRIRLDLAEVALDLGADPAVTIEGGGTLLAWAAMSHRPRTVRLLMRYGARERVGAEAFQSLVQEVRDSPKIDDRKKRQVLEALGAGVA